MDNLKFLDSYQAYPVFHGNGTPGSWNSRGNSPTFPSVLPESLRIQDSMDLHDDREAEEEFEDFILLGILDRQNNHRVPKQQHQREKGSVSMLEAILWVLLALVITSLLLESYDGPGRGVIALAMWIGLSLTFGWIRHRR